MRNWTSYILIVLQYYFQSFRRCLLLSSFLNKILSLFSYNLQYCLIKKTCIEVSWKIKHEIQSMSWGILLYLIQKNIRTQKQFNDLLNKDFNNDSKLTNNNRTVEILVSQLFLYKFFTFFYEKNNYIFIFIQTNLDININIHINWT